MRSQLQHVCCFILTLAISGTASAQKGKLKETINTDLPVSCIEVSPNKMLVAISENLETPLSFDEIDEEYCISIFKTTDLKKINVLRGHADAIEGVSFSSDSKRLISADRDGVINMWDLTSGKKVLTVETGDWVHDVKFVSSGYEFVVIQGFNKTAFLYDGKGVLISTFEVGKQINDFDFNPTTDQIYFGCHREFQVWSLVTRKMIYSMPHAGLLCMEFNHDYSVLAIGTFKDVVLLTAELEEIDRLIGHFKPVIDLSFSFDDEYLASASCDQTARVWRLKTSSAALELTNEHQGCVYSVEFISEDKHFMTGGESKELKVWK